MNHPTRTFNMNQPGCLFLFGLFWVGFSSIFVIIGLTQDNIAFALFGLLFVLVGVGILGFALFSYYTRFRIGRPEITISEQTLRVGESFTVSYLHSFNRNVQVDGIRVALIFKETATYQRGTDTTTVTHDHIIAEFEEPGGRFQAGHLIQQSYDLQIPPTGMHTLKVRRNKLEWFVRFQMNVPKLPDLVEQFELDVLPVLMR